MTDDRLATLFAGQRKTALAWRTSTAAGRVLRISRLLSAIQDHRADLLGAAAGDFNRPAAEVSLTELVGIVREARTAMRQTARWMKPRHRASTLVGFGTAAWVRPEPRGRSLIISPWNYPFLLTFGPLISALAAGCPAIIKPSEITPRHAALISRIVADAFPPAEVAVVEGDAALASSLLALPFEHIFFTGGACINHCLIQFARGNVPFGGINDSGFGSADGPWGFAAFSHERAFDRQSRGPHALPSRPGSREH